MSNSSYRVALVGAGGIARTHTTACALTARAHLVAVCDLSQAALDRYREHFPEVPAVYLDLDRMLAREDVDIAVICTWGAHHAAVGERLSRSGKVRAILCEKPFTQTAREAERLVAAARAGGTLIVEAFKFRHHPLHLKARALLDAGRIGEPRVVRSTFCTGRGQVARTPTRTGATIAGAAAAASTTWGVTTSTTPAGSSEPSRSACSPAPGAASRWTTPRTSSCCSPVDGWRR